MTVDIYLFKPTDKVYCLRYVAIFIAYAILLTCENVCDIDIACPNMHSGDNIAQPYSSVIMYSRIIWS